MKSLIIDKETLENVIEARGGVRYCVCDRRIGHAWYLLIEDCFSRLLSNLLANHNY
jgi:hypothetical protein